MRGEAADISTNALSTPELFDAIRQSGIEFDQMIEEFGSWVHISYREGRNRNQCLLARRSRGRVKYTQVPR